MLPNRSELNQNDSVIIEIKDKKGKMMKKGVIRKILTKTDSHPYGIMVELTDSSIGRVQEKINGDQIQENSGNSEEDLLTEFKNTFKFDTKIEIFKKQGKNDEVEGRKKDEGKIQHALKKEIAIAIAAFANSDGGQLIIGKNDEGEISEYFENDKKLYKNWDAYTLAIINSIEEFTKNRPFVSQIRLIVNEDKKFLTLNVPKSTLEPIIIYDKGQEEFYIRTVVAKSQKLQPSEMINYCKIHFPQWIGKRK